MRNKITGALLMTALFSMGSCSLSVLDQDNPNALTKDSFWQTAEDAKANLTAVYSSFRDQYYNRFIPIAWRGDDVQGTASNANYSQFDTFLLSDANTTCATAWAQNFKGIYYANQVIHYVPRINMDEVLRERYVGEAKFLRGYFYLTLYLEFKNIPLITDIIESKDEYNQPQATPERVLEQIANDFEDASNSLPMTYPTADLGRITRGAALGYLAKVRMIQQEWQKASDALDAIVQSKTYNLLSSYQDVFLEKNDFNKEVLLEIPFFKAKVDGKDLSTSDNKREAMSKVGGWYMYWPTQWLFDEMKKELTVDGEYDPRLYASIIFPNTKMKYYGKTYEDWFGKNTKSLGWGKYSEWDVLSGKISSNSGKNQRLLRYADILLLQAECLCRLDRVTEAVPYVNMVRKRAKLMELSRDVSKNDLLIEIEHQRVIELACEMNRWFDLFRWNGNILGTKNIKEVFEEHGDGGAKNFEVGKSELMPIPASEMQINPLIVQNPNY